MWLCRETFTFTLEHNSRSKGQTKDHQIQQHSKPSPQVFMALESISGFGWCVDGNYQRVWLVCRRKLSAGLVGVFKENIIHS
jgi:hypothetical protein